MSRYADMDPIRRQDKDSEAEAAQYAAEQRDDYTANRSRCGTCGYCGSRDGMKGLDRVAVADTMAWDPRMPFWQWSPDKHHLYRPCPECNSGHVVPADYEPMSREQVREWLATLCDCTACMMDRGEI